ncbi:MAG TPA: hypothetical protein VHW93_10445 [Acidimicrobiales bacterium]|nr:hypothetical protein [Acidimicrobiales bacterium]
MAGPASGPQVRSDRGVDGTGPARGYTPPVHFLFICTANICRSPMAAALFAEHIENLSDPVAVSSSGIRAGAGMAGRGVPDEVLQVMAPYGIDLRTHRSQALTQPMLEEADLIVGMSRRHVQEAVLIDPPSWPKAFMLKELVRRGSELGPRRPDQGIRSWIDGVHGDRTRESLARRSSTDDVVDPYGKSLERYRATAAELAELTTMLAMLVWPEVVLPTDGPRPRPRRVAPVDDAHPSR